MQMLATVTVGNYGRLSVGGVNVLRPRVDEKCGATIDPEIATRAIRRWPYGFTAEVSAPACAGVQESGTSASFSA